MNIKELKNYVKLNRFFIDYCGIDYSSLTRHKMRGKDSAGNPITFTHEEHKAIKKGWKLLAADIYSTLKE